MLRNIECVCSPFRVILIALILTLTGLNSQAQSTSVTAAEAQTIARLYSAGLGRVPAFNGLNFFVSSVESGRSVLSIAEDFVLSDEFVAKYGPLNDTQFVERLFLNVLGRPGAQGGIGFWVDNLATGSSRAFVLTQFADSPENIENTADLYGNMAFLDGQWQFGDAVANFIQPCAAGNCWHPLEIRGNGSIVERIFGQRGCSFEEFQASSTRCTQNAANDERYLVSYDAKPEPGWKFDHWEGFTCDEETIEPYCEFDISRDQVNQINADTAEGAALRATIAVFVTHEVGPPPAGIDTLLHSQISSLRLTGDPRPESTTALRSPLAQLGMKLFFSKSLSGEFDTACASCHHPALAGGDELSLPVGTQANNPDLLGLGREHLGGKPLVGRNSQTTFNSGLHETRLFWDGRVGLLFDDTIRTPDSMGFLETDPNAGEDLLAAQARFPVTEPDEMRSHNFLIGADGQELRARLAARIGDYGDGAGEIENNNWLVEFVEVFGAGIPREELVTYENIALAISAYQKSQSFVNNPWRDYVQGDYEAISVEAKDGAFLFLREPPITGRGENGAGCAFCHKGDFFTNEEYEAVGFPQIGEGKVAGSDDDIGRGALRDGTTLDYRFRTSSLLNIAATAPYGHAGAYETLRDVVEHYGDAVNTVALYFANGGWCQLPQFSSIAGCAGFYPNAESNTQKARDKVLEENEDNRGMFDITLSSRQINQLLAFLETLTDPCVLDRDCVAPWIPKPEDAPDGHQLLALDKDGSPL